MQHLGRRDLNLSLRKLASSILGLAIALGIEPLESTSEVCRASVHTVLSANDLVN